VKWRRDVKWRQALDEFERTYWLNALQEAGGNVRAAATRAGLCRAGAYRALKRLSIPVQGAHIGAWHRPLPGEHDDHRNLGG
jgi:DNA-binding NtrC family response regulator